MNLNHVMTHATSIDERQVTACGLSQVHAMRLLEQASSSCVRVEINSIRKSKCRGTSGTTRKKHIEWLDSTRLFAEAMQIYAILS